MGGTLAVGLGTARGGYGEGFEGRRSGYSRLIKRGDEPHVITPDWPAHPRVHAAFTLRTGGVSRAPYDSLNLGAAIGDAAEAVAENRRRVRGWLRTPGEPVWLEQVHGVGVVDLASIEPGLACAESDLASVDTTPPRGDAAVSRAGGPACAIRVADCMPVLFAARDGSVVGASHAGWRGLAAGVLESTVRKMGVESSQLIAWLGPAIGPGHFEVGDDVRAAFLTNDGGVSAAFLRNARGRWQCDLYALARRRLAALGVADVYGGGWCTFADATRFFSYRRDGQCGRMAALIWSDPSNDAGW
jgi:YfiH family protein